MDVRQMSAALDRRSFLGVGGSIAGAALLSLTLGGCSSDSPSPGSAGKQGGAGLDFYRKNGLKLTYITNPPFSYADPQTGKIVGAGPVVLQEILRNIGITKLSYAMVPFASEISQITSQRSDMSANNFNANADRCEQIAFSNPVALYHQGALVAKGNPKSLHSYDDIAKHKSVTIAILRGDASIDWLKSYGVGTSRLLQFDALPQAVTAVSQGRADVYLNAIVTLNQEVSKPEGSKLEVAQPFAGPVVDGAEIITNASYAIRYDEIELINAVNGQIKKLITSGQMRKLLKPYGYPANSVPAATMTAKSICPKGHWPAAYKDLSR